MDKEWIIDVLDDLKVFAAKNSLPHLARQLEETLALAETELAEHSKGARLSVVHGDATTPGKVYREARTGSNP
ncbi:MAG: hypothetical protein AAGA47_01280 [Pseudomonadota bacterium]